MNKSSTVWIINQYASTPDSGMGGRHYALAQGLVARGINVYLIMASFHHLLHTPLDCDKTYNLSKAGGLNVVHVRVPRYEDAHDSRRILNWSIFAYRLLGLKSFIDDRPDAILYSSLSLIGVLSAERLARHYGIPLTFEVRDIWPLTLTEIGGRSPRHPFVQVLQWIEDRAYRTSYRVISNLPGFVDHLVERGGDAEKFVWIPNGVSLSEMTNASSPVDEALVAEIPDNRFVVGYAGTHGIANALDNFLSAAALLRDYPSIVLVLVGRGKEKERLQARAKDERLCNVIFLPAVPKSQVPAVLNMFDVCFIGWNDEPLYRYGIGANKIPEYLFSGKPIIHAFSGGFDPVVQFGAGLTVPAEDSQLLAKGILDLYHMSPEMRATMGENGRKAVVDHYDYARLVTRLEAVLFPG